VSDGVSTALLALTVACVVANAFIVAADLAKTRFVLANSAEVGLRPAALPYLAVLKGAGAAGLVVGLAGIAPLGLAAAVGLVLFYLCAVGAHVRASVFHNIAFPLLFLALALSASIYFALALTSGSSRGFSLVVEAGCIGGFPDLSSYSLISARLGLAST
jgi:hypothetical protein